MKKIIILIIIAFGIFLGFQISGKISSASRNGSGQNGKGRRGAAVVPVETKAVIHMDMEDVGTFTGSLYPVSQFRLASKISGRLKKINFHVGDFIRGGDTIAVVDSEELTQALEEAKADLLIVKARLSAAENTFTKQIEKAQADVDRWKASSNLAEKELKRQEELRRKSVSSETERDRANEQVQVTSAQVTAAQKTLELLTTQQTEDIRRIKAEILRSEAGLKTAEIKLSYSDIKAEWDPEAGTRVVGERFLDEGAMLTSGNPVISILDIDTLIATITVTEKDYTKLKLEQIVKIHTDAYPDRNFEGTILRIAPKLDEASRVARVDVKIPNREHLLKPGMFVRANIIFTTHTDATAIPRPALVSRDGIEGVFGIDTGPTAQFIPVTVGIRSRNFIEVIAPPVSGEVVTMGHHMLSHGTPVLIANATEKTDKGKAEADKSRTAESKKVRQGENKR
ncbi:MAG: hypothetical protein CVV64_15815 [Candidatus Wallbacteria bacterium HGW-Wallbacteria-1]|jgi:RND family efflux transporter MFP subunit|uniref:CusB-like beta-barrel domain-containing protein n=1 Tax=Candidatus Wallbacteria bacterium HGW-Wallbacteria-1 TaxID=2013854 RepID=A0A2N1PL58_9BACT|nr:MAG: hypothetical protein CVV64_15815 [Candidatus Wallbacteria bacterium HGW-Wallbacteria-1]